MLTQSARNYVFTTDDTWADRYREFEPLLDVAIKSAMADGDKTDRLLFGHVDGANQALVEMEYKSLSLTRQGRSSEAIRILESPEYWDLKRIYGNNLSDYISRKGLLGDKAQANSVNSVLAATAIAKESAQSGQQWIWIISVVFFGIMVTIVVIVDRSIILPLKRLSDTAAAIGQGSFDISTEVNANDEVGSLASSIEQMALDLQSSTTSIERLNKEVAERRRAEEAQTTLSGDMEERIKELSCLYGITEIIARSEDMAAAMQDVVALIPTGWKYSEKARAKVRLNSVEYLNEPFEETEWVLTSIILANGMRCGAVEVYYLERTPEMDEHPFLLEERNLIAGISLTIGQAVEREQAQRSKVVLQGKLVQSDKLASIGQLSAGVAHEINNPMGFITSNLNTMRKYLSNIASFLENEASGDSDQRTSMAEMVTDFGDAITESLDGAHRVKKIVEDLKGFTRADSGKMELTDLNESLDRAITIVWNQIKYTCKLEKHLGDLPSVQCHQGRIDQVLMNLMINAGQAIGKGPGTIRVRTWADDAQCYISVKDDGCGIPAENLDRIFEPFYTTKDIGQGTGLGLSICFDIIKSHGGMMNVCSKVREGSEFVISLPLETVNMPTAATVPEDQV